MMFTGTGETYVWGKHPDAADYVTSGHYSSGFSEITKHVEKIFGRKDIQAGSAEYEVQFYLMPGLMSKPVCGTIRHSSDRFGRPCPLIKGQQVVEKYTASEWEQLYAAVQPEKPGFDEMVTMSRVSDPDPDCIRFKLTETGRNTVYSILKQCRIHIRRKPKSFFVYENSLDLFYRKPDYRDMVRMMISVTGEGNGVDHES